MAAKKKVGSLKRKSVSMKKAAKVKGGSLKFRLGKSGLEGVGGETRDSHAGHGGSGSDHG